jgi:hypothetical protein
MTSLMTRVADPLPSPAAPDAAADAQAGDAQATPSAPEPPPQLESGW